MATVVGCKTCFSVSVAKSEETALPSVVTAQGNIENALSAITAEITVDSGVKTMTDKLFLSITVVKDATLGSVIPACITAIESITGAVYTVTAVNGFRTTKEVDDN